MRLIRSSFAWRLAILLLLMSFLPIAVMAVFVRHTVAESFVTLTSQETHARARQLAAAVSLLDDESAVKSVLTASSDEQHLALLISGDGRTVIRPQGYREEPSGPAVLPNSTIDQVIITRDGVLTEATSGDVVGYAPVSGNTQIAVVILEGSVITSAVQQMVAATFIQLGASLLIIVILAGLAIWVVMGPIRHLTRAAEEVGAGRLDVEINPNEMEGELAVLALAFNQMTKRLQESYDTLERRVALRTQELATVNAISDLVSQSLDLNVIFQTALDQTIEIGHFDVGAAYRLADDGRGFDLAANRGVSEEIVRYVKTLPLGRIQNPVENGVAQPGARAVTDYPDSELKQILEREGLRTVVSVPLVAKGKTVGAMGLATRSARELSAQDLSLLAAIGQQVGMAVENARLYEHAEQIAVAAERNRLARDLHDAVTQTLFSASLIADVLPRIFERNPDEGRRRLEELRQLTRGALAEMRTLLLELRPAALVEAPLHNLMRHLAEATTGRARIPVALTAEEGIAVPADVQVALYRIAQEALNNVAKHSGASEAAISLREIDGQVELTIGDNGRGFDPASVSSDHLGLGIIRERAQTIGATLRLESEPQRGTHLVVTWARSNA